MAAHEHLAEAQFHRREGRPNKSEHHADGRDEDSSAPKKPHVHVHKQQKPKHHR
jgi:hypothetical protein